MKFPQKHTLKQIATLIDADIVGDEDFPILGMNEIHRVTPGDIVFVDHPKYYEKALRSAATVILINKKVDCPSGKALLISEDPFRDFNKLTTYFKPFQKATDNIATSAQIGENTIIQPNVFIGNHVKIGKNCIIHPNVCLYDYTVIEDNVTIHSGSILGADAFYYKNRLSGYDRLKSGGYVHIESNVEIGAACTIDRGVSGETRVKEGTKIDNQVQVGHDTIIGKKCLIASQCGIAGCVILEDEVTLWGQVGIKSDVRIGKKAVVLAQSGVGKSLGGEKTYFGSPANEARKMYREAVLIRQIPELIKKNNS